MIYDPYQPPDPDEWLELPEIERNALVLDYHQSTEEELPNPTLHAVIHTTVENQIALGNENPVKAKLLKLMREGLDRHDALHDIGSALIVYIFDLLLGEASDDEPNPHYYQALEALTEKSWRRGD